MQTTNITVVNINPEKKKKCKLVLVAKGKTLSDEVRKMIDEYAEEFDRMKLSM